LDWHWEKLIVEGAKKKTDSLGHSRETRRQLNPCEFLQEPGFSRVEGKTRDGDWDDLEASVKLCKSIFTEELHGPSNFWVVEVKGGCDIQDGAVVCRPQRQLFLF